MNSPAVTAEPYLNFQIGVHQNLEFKVLFSLVAHFQRSFQGIPCEGNTVHETELVRPRLAELLT